ncbi:MAG TPA: hypothetical protein PLA12_09185 [Candidatus Hydrogenedens sp.]|nr:hypothetical protein [Candidatus Hydrogenedens sp.]
MKEIESLCELLEEQAERQETLVSVCVAQLRAGFEGNIKYFNEKTSAMDYLVKETARFEFIRQELVDKICRNLGINLTDKRIRDIAEQVGEPWRSQIIDSCDRMKVSVLYLKSWLGKAVPFYRVSLESAKSTLKKIYPDYEEQNNSFYTDSNFKKAEIVLTRFVDDRG